MKTILVDMKFVVLAIVLAIYTQVLTTGTPIFSMLDSFIAMLLVIFISLVVKRYIPSSLPAFVYATLIGIFLCLPDTFFREWFINSVAKVSFLSCTVPLLAFAGLSVGRKIDELKQMSWKVIVIFLIVSTACFFGAALVAQVGFSMQGLI